MFPPCLPRSKLHTCTSASSTPETSAPNPLHRDSPGKDPRRDKPARQRENKKKGKNRENKPREGKKERGHHRVLAIKRHQRRRKIFKMATAVQTSARVKEGFFFHRFIILETKLVMAEAGWSGSSSANRWLTLSVVLPCFLATNPKSLA